MSKNLNDEERKSDMEDFDGDGFGNKAGSDDEFFDCLDD
jgi:hypothetical protein